VFSTNEQKRRRGPVRTMPTSQNRDMGGPGFELCCLEGLFDGVFIH